jgi:hypothetical protein
MFGICTALSWPVWIAELSADKPPKPVFHLLLPRRNLNTKTRLVASRFLPALLSMGPCRLPCYYNQYINAETCRQRGVILVAQGCCRT